MEWREINRFSSFTAGCCIYRLDAVARAYLSTEVLKCSRMHISSSYMHSAMGGGDMTEDQSRSVQ